MTPTGAAKPVALMRIITRLNIGGPARQALLLSRALDPSYHTTLVAGTAPVDEGELSDPQVPVVRVPLVRPIRPADDGRALRALRQLLANTRPRLVHTHMAKAGTLGRLAAVTSRPRPITVHTFHGHVLEGYFHPAVGQSLLRVERWLARRTTAFVAVSPEIRDQLLDLGIGEPHQWRVIPLGLDLDPFLAVRSASGRLREHLNLIPQTPLVGAVGRLVPIKNLSLLLRAVAPLPDVHLALVGDGESRKVLEAEATALGLNERVHFTGWWPDIPDAMADLDLVALSSRNEGTPVALIEALACGRPVVATDVGGVRYVLRDGRYGALLPSDDVAAFTAAIAECLSQRRGPDAAPVRREIASRFGQQRLVADIQDLYAELLTSG